MQVKASYTVEAALICPLICLTICGMLLLTLRFYGMAKDFAEELMTRQRNGITSARLIRLEAAVEELFEAGN